VRLARTEGAPKTSTEATHLPGFLPSVLVVDGALSAVWNFPKIAGVAHLPLLTRQAGSWDSFRLARYPTEAPFSLAAAFGTANNRSIPIPVAPAGLFALCS